MSPSHPPAPFLLSLPAVAATTVGLAAAGYYVYTRMQPGKGHNTVVDTGADDESTKIYIYFASQTGTGEAFAIELADEARELGALVEVVDLDDFQAGAFARHHNVIVIAATYGEGDTPDNAEEFNSWLTHEATEDCLEGLKFAVMGLGNTQYVHFNEFGAHIDRRLEQLGGRRVYQLGLGDDDRDIEEDFAKWKDGGLWGAVQKKMMGRDRRSMSVCSTSHKQVTDVRTRLDLVANFNSVKTKLPYDATVQGGGSDVVSKFYFNSHEAVVHGIRELRQQPDGEGLSTVHLDVDISKLPALRYRTADNLEILPRNSVAVVIAVAERFGCEKQLDQFVSFTRSGRCSKAIVKKPFPTPCTLRTALSLYCDLNGHPSRAFVRDMCSMEEGGQEAEEVLGEMKGELVTVAEALCGMFKTSPLSVGEFIQIVPRQKYRPYTVASSNLETPKLVSTTLGLVHHKREGQAPLRGVTTQHLCTVAQPGDKLWIQIRTSSFRLPVNPTTPIVMISAGTGIAPMRAFMRELTTKPRPDAKVVMLFGCTHSKKDWIYADEMKYFAKSPLCKLHTAFSREQAHTVYVQDLLRSSAQQDVVDAVSAGGHVYICGSSTMGHGVVEALVGLGVDVEKMRREKKLVEELWG